MSNETKIPKSLKSIKEMQQLLALKNKQDLIVNLKTVLPFFEIQIPDEKIELLIDVIELVKQKKGNTDIDSMTKLRFNHDAKKRLINNYFSRRRR